MRRRLINVLTVLSLLLCVAMFTAAAALWPASYLRTDSLGWDTGRGHCQLTSDRGEAQFFWMPGAPRGQFSVGHTGWGHSPGNWSAERVGTAFLGFRVWRPDPATMRYPVQVYAVPYWFILLVTAPAAITWAAGRLRRRIRARRAAAGRCPSCGYDLTGNTSGTCPECGSAVAKGAP